MSKLFPKRSCSAAMMLLFVLLPTDILVGGYSLKGKQALVTGSPGGIGKGIALELVKRGVKVIIHYNSRKQEAFEMKELVGDDHCLAVLQCDFREPETIPEFMDQVLESCGEQGLDILVNNAGAVNKLALEDDTNDLRMWHETLAINLHAPNMLSKLALPSLKRNKGVILNVGSIHSEKSNEYMGAYATSKAGLDSLTRTMAIEFAKYQVRVNCIAPGMVPVERTAYIFADPANLKPWEERMVVGRCGTVEDVAQACIPLLENDWITGTVWQVDGGMMARANMPPRPRPDPPN